MNSRAKGARGERDWAKWLAVHLGAPAIRGQQRSGTECADVLGGIPGTHPEVKRVEALNLENAMLQAEHDAAPGEIPYVAHRRNRTEWCVTVRADRLLEFAEAVLGTGKFYLGDIHPGGEPHS